MDFTEADDELLDLVDDHDAVTGTIRRGDFYQAAPDYPGNIRACEVLIRNDAGKFWIPKRTAHKRIAPNGLDYSAGGHVGSGQTYLEAALREIKEELGLELQPADLVFVRKFAPQGTPFFRSLFIYHSNQTPRFNPDDFVSAEWLSLEELQEKLESGVPCKTSLKETVRALVENNTFTRSQK